MDIMRRFLQKKKISSGGSVIQEHSPKEYSTKFGISNAPAEWQELRESYYKKWLGDSDNIKVWHEAIPVIPHIDIYEFPPSVELGRNFYTLITSGMSDEKMTLPKGVDKEFARAELIFYVANEDTKIHATERPWYIQAMTFLAHFPFDYKTWLAFSHTIPNGNPPAPVVVGSALTTALLLPAFYEKPDFYGNFKLDNERVLFYWLTYLTDKETEFKLKYGYDKLEEKFTSENMPQVFNPFRQSIV